MSQKRIEIDEVTQKVKNTKREINHLKAELEKLINSGINSEKHFQLKTVDKENFLHNFQDAESKPETRITFRNLSDAEKQADLRNACLSSHVSRRDVPKSHTLLSNGSSTRNASKSPECNKKCSYNKEGAREYIKKQKEKRKEQAKVSAKDSHIDAETRKQKLNDLHKKSLQLVMKNVEQKRKRSQSRETVKQTESVAQDKVRDLRNQCHAVAHIPDLIMTNVVDNEQRNAQKLNKVTEKSSRTCNRETNKKGGKNSGLIKPNEIVNVPVDQRKKNVTVTKEIQSPHVPVADNPYNAAVTKIQACFRGYQQRKRYNKIKNNRVQVRVAKQSATVETQTETKAEVPKWLNPATLSHPYNFITTVKRKLNFAINTSSLQSSKVNVAVQSSDASPKMETPKQELFQKTKNEIKEALERSAKSGKSYRSDNLWSLISQRSPLYVGGLKSPEALKSQPRVEVEGNAHSKTVPNSDSDTSKNIPNISSESSVHSNKIDTGKRSVTTTNLKLKTNSLHTDYPTDSDRSDHKLDTDRLKDLKLERKKYPNGKTQTQASELSSRSAYRKKLEKKPIRKGNSFEGSIKPLRSFSEADVIISSNASKYTTQRKSSIKSAETGSTVTSADIIASNLSRNASDSRVVKTSTEEKPKSTESISEHLQPPSNLKLQLPKTVESMRSASHKSASSSVQGTTIQTNGISDADESYSDSFSIVSSKDFLDVPPLEHPDVTVYPEIQDVPFNEASTPNVISLKEGDKVTLDTKKNEIHLKIEAELHFLNDFNESLKKFVDLEKSVLELKDKHKQSFVAVKEKGVEALSLPQSAKENTVTAKSSSEKSGKEIRTINYSRGSDVSDDMSLLSLNSDFGINKGILSAGFEISNLNETKDSTISGVKNESSVIVNESILKAPFVGVSLGMFEQLIKDEDTRIENLKTILKIREKALLDRTKGELALLEIQRKHLKETGQLHEASLLKKKQRGVLMRLQHEHHEMQRLKQMQKTASKERKAALKQQCNMIKAQLSTDKMLTTKTKLNAPREGQRHSGPFKVYNIQSHSESVRSETSVSRNSVTEEIISVTSRSQSVVSRVSDVEVAQARSEDGKSGSDVPKVDQIKKSLLMREAALQKRRKAAEELLRWHKKLMEEEKKVAELEMVANSIINEVSKAKMTKKDGPVTQRSRDDKKYKSGKFSGKDNSYDSINTDLDYSSDVSSVIKTVSKKSEQDNNYTSDFDSPTSLNNKEVSGLEKLKHNDKIASITELIDNLTKINDENSILSKRSSLNKSIDAEIDKLASIRTDPKSNSSAVKTFRLETNKLLNLKEHLHQDNSKAILDSIESLRSSIQEITSRADRGRRRIASKLEVQSSEKNVSVVSASIPNEPDAETVLPEESAQVSERSAGDDKVSDTADVSCAESLRTDVNGFSGKETSEKSEFEADNSSSEVCHTGVLKTDDSYETYSVETCSQTKPDVSDKLESVHDSSNEDNSLKTVSDVTVEENKILLDTAQSSEKRTEISAETSEGFVAQILSAPSVFIEVDKRTESEIATNGEQCTGHSLEEEKTDVILSEQLEDERGSFAKSTETSAPTDHVIAENGSEILLELTEGDIPSVESHEVSKLVEESREQSCKNVVDKLETEDAETVAEEVLSQKQIEVVADDVASNADTLSDLSNNSVFSSTDQEQFTKDINLKRGDVVASNGIESVEEDSHVDADAISQVESLPQVLTEPSDENKDTSISSKQNEDQSVRVDVKKRVSEILADANCTFNTGERSPRVQDLYVTTYDLISPASSPESRSPVDNNNVNSLLSSKGCYDNEAEELLKKQLAIEQEIKQIEQQQKEQIPYVFMREIPNKPPPPYTPPVAAPASAPPSVLPSSTDQVDTSAAFAANVLHRAYLAHNLENITFEEQMVDESVLRCVEKSCLNFLFDVCKELAVEHYEKFKIDEGPAWTRIVNKQKLSFDSPFGREELERYLNRRLKVLLGYEKVERRENAVMKWSRKKRDHVDEILVLESQAEESEWTNYDRDELYVKNEVTNEIMNMLLSETAEVLSRVLMNKTKRLIF